MYTVLFFSLLYDYLVIDKRLCSQVIANVPNTSTSSSSTQLMNIFMENFQLGTGRVINV